MLLFSVKLKLELRNRNPTEQGELVEVVVLDLVDMVWANEETVRKIALPIPPLSRCNSINPIETHTCFTAQGENIVCRLSWKLKRPEKKAWVIEIEIAVFKNHFRGVANMQLVRFDGVDVGVTVNWVSHYSRGGHSKLFSLNFLPQYVLYQLFRSKMR